LELEMINL